MTSDVQDLGPVDALVDMARAVVPDWLERITIDTAARAGVRISPDDERLRGMIDATAARLLEELSVLVRTDVDEQRQSPLTLFRSAVASPTAFLRDVGVAPPTRDGFEREHFPDDPYRLGPATWSDVHPDLHEPGLTWGAWKAMTVLRRRREQGLR